MKSNGTDGGILIGFHGAQFGDISTKEPVYVYFDGLPVPFFFVDLSQKGQGKAIAHLNDVDTLDAAEELVGKDIYADWEDLGAEEGLSFLEGWELAGVGTIVEVLDIPSNPCVEVATDKGPVLVPLHEDLIRDMDKDSKTLVMDIPEGILDIQ